MDNVRDLMRHPSVGECPTAELAEEVLRSQLRRQDVINWVLGGVGIAVLLVVLGVAVAVWRFALTF